MEKVIKDWKLSVFPNGDSYLLVGKDIVQVAPKRYESVFQNEMIRIDNIDKEPGLYSIEITIKL